LTTATKTRTKRTPKQLPGLWQQSLIPAMTEVERYVDYAKRDMGFKDIGITVVIQSQGQRNCYGYFTNDEVYKSTSGKDSHEIQISSEHLARPGIDIYATVRHELVHANNWECGVKDCSNKGNYHNRKFKASAESYGLVCHEKTTSHGYGITTLDAVYAAQVIVELQPDDNAFTLARKILANRKPKAKTAMLKWTCGCTNIRAATEVTATCHACGEVFARA
jgi:hypothetical protein